MIAGSRPETLIARAGACGRVADPQRPRAPAREETPAQAALRRAIQRAEEARAAIPEVPPRVRFEMRRKALHVVTAIVAVPMLLVLPFPLALGLAFAGIVVITATWVIERRRLHHIMLEPYRDFVHDPLAHVLQATRRPGEDYPWSPVLYTTALVIIALAHQALGLSWVIAFAAYAILGLGDAASALVGVAYGRRKLPWNRKKSLEGTLAGLAAGFLAGVVFASIPYAFAGLAVPPLFFAMVLLGAGAGALAETVPRVEDNFVVPLASAAAMFAFALATGVPLP